MNITRSWDTWSALSDRSCHRRLLQVLEWCITMFFGHHSVSLLLVLSVHVIYNTGVLTKYTKLITTHWTPPPVHMVRRVHCLPTTHQPQLCTSDSQPQTVNHSEHFRDPQTNVCTDHVTFSILNLFQIILHTMHVYKCVVSIVWIWFLSLYNRNVYKICICLFCRVRWMMYDVILWTSVAMESYAEVVQKVKAKKEETKERSHIWACDKSRGWDNWCQVAMT